MSYDLHFPLFLKYLFSVRLDFFLSLILFYFRDEVSLHISRCLKFLVPLSQPAKCCDYQLIPRGQNFFFF